MKEQTNYTFYGMLEKDIEIELRRTLDCAVRNKYGEAPNDIIVCRIEEEWDAIKRNNMIYDVAMVYEIVQWLKEKRYPYWMRGCAGSSFVLYLLGITFGNPLPPHLYCPKCKAVEFSLEFKDGFDIAGEIECPDDNSKRIVDGHSIPWQTLWGYNKEAVLELLLPKDIYEIVLTTLNGDWAAIDDSSVYIDGRYEEGVKSLDCSNVSLTFVLESEKISKRFYDNFFSVNDWEHIMNTLEVFVQYEADCELNIPSPTNFAELVAAYGLIHSNGAWDKITEFMFYEIGYSLSDMIAFRDDVFYYLTDHGFSEVDAWRGMERTRKGRGLPVITPEMISARDFWVLGICNKVKYLLPKSHAVEYLLFKLFASM